jgi:hypothetical protein
VSRSSSRPSNSSTIARRMARCNSSTPTGLDLAWPNYQRARQPKAAGPSQRWEAKSGDARRCRPFDQHGQRVRGIAPGARNLSVGRPEVGGFRDGSCVSQAAGARLPQAGREAQRRRCTERAKGRLGARRPHLAWRGSQLEAGGFPARRPAAGIFWGFPP